MAGRARGIGPNQRRTRRWLTALIAAAVLAIAGYLTVQQSSPAPPQPAGQVGPFPRGPGELPIASSSLSPPAVQDGEFTAAFLGSELRGADYNSVTLSQARSAARFVLRLPDPAVSPEKADLRLAVQYHGGGFGFFYARGLSLRANPSEVPSGAIVASALELRGSVAGTDVPRFFRTRVRGFVAAAGDQTVTARADGTPLSPAPAAVLWEEPGPEGGPNTWYELLGWSHTAEDLIKVANTLR